MTSFFRAFRRTATCLITFSIGDLWNITRNNLIRPRRILIARTNSTRTCFRRKSARRSATVFDHNEAKGLEILRAAEGQIQTRGVGDSEAIYKLAQAYAVLATKLQRCAC